MLIERAGDRFFIPLPYGADTDWCLNVREAGHALIVTKGEAYEVIHPALVDIDAIEGVYPEWMRIFLEAVQTEQALRVERASAGPEPHSVYRRIVDEHPVTRGLAVVAGVGLGIAFAVWLIRREDTDR